MNTMILGLPRNGKGLYSMTLVVEEMVKGSRPLVTNLAVEKLPWVTKKHQTRRGLVSYLEEKYKGHFDCVDRIFRISDDAMKNFWLYRPLSAEKVASLIASGAHLVGYREVTPLDNVLSPGEMALHKNFRLFVADHDMRKDKNGRDVLVSFNPVLLEHSGGVMNVADECWKFWAARSWQSTGDADVFYNAQHGKFGDDNLFITHRHNDIDSVIVDRCQECVVVTHQGKMRFGYFRRPNIFTVDTFAGRPMPSKEPMTTTRFTLDVEGLAQTYDTSAGVGVTGRGAADVGGRVRGLPFWVLPVLVALVMVAVGCGIKYGFGAVHGFFHSKASGGHSVAHGGPVSSPDVVPIPALYPSPFHSVVSGPGETARGGRSEDPSPVILGRSDFETNAVVCVGFSVIAGDVTCFFSDGTTAYSSDSEVDDVEPHWVTCWGHRFRVVVGAAVTPPGSSYDSAPRGPWGQVSGPAPVNTVDILPTIHGQGGDSPPALGGFSAMANRFQNQGQTLQ